MIENARHSNSRVNCWKEPAPNAAAQALREARVAEGEVQRAAEREAFRGLRVTHTELMLPVLHLLEEAGRARPAELYDALVGRLGLAGDVRDAAKQYGKQTTVLFDRTVRWCLQEGKRKGLMTAPARGQWQATDAGAALLGRVQPGIQITIFRTDLGKAIAACAEEAACVVEPGSLQALFTSPVFPILKAKEYAGMSPAEWLPGTSIS